MSNDKAIIGADPLSQRLAAWRARQRLSREAAAQLIGVSAKQYARWEQGRFKRSPGRLSLEAIERALTKGERL